MSIRYTYGGGAPNPDPYAPDRERCPQCGGSGIEEWELYCSQQNKVAYGADDCRACGGTGYVEYEPEYEDQPVELIYPGEPETEE